MTARPRPRATARWSRWQRIREQVDQVYAKAIELGGADEGGPGSRGPEQMGFYGAYFRDPDGNKLCVFKMG